MTAPLDLSFRFDPRDRQMWREQVEASRSGSLESLTTTLEGGIEIQPIYDSAHGQPGLSRPGAPPFRRGALPEPGWRLVHEAHGADREAVLASARRAADGGADAVYLSPSAFADLDPEAIEAISLPVIADPGPEAVAWLGALRDVPGAELRYDPLGALARLGRLPYDAGAAERLIGEMAAHGRRILVDTTRYHHAGASLADEIGLALATGVQYLRWLSARGHPLADAPKRIGFAFACDTDVFAGIAKLRAARLTWSKVLRAVGIDGDTHGMRIHAFGSRRGYTSLEPLLGVLRGCAAGFAAIVGGAQDVTLPRHEPTLSAERLARNTQHLLRDESHLGRVADPAGGAYYVETLTDQIARAGWATLQAIEAEGGMAAALLSGHVRERVHASATRRRAAYARRSVGLVGVNRYPLSEPPAFEIVADEAPTPASSPARAPKALRDAIADAPRGGLAGAIEASDVDPRVLAQELARGGGEMTCRPLAVERDAAPFEALLARTAALPEERRRALVLGVGDVRALGPRVAFAREALRVAGLEVASELGAEMPSLSTDDVPPTVAVCSSEPLGPIVEALHGLGAEQVLLIGPEDPDVETQGRLHRGMDVLASLGALLDRIGAS